MFEKWAAERGMVPPPHPPSEMGLEEHGDSIEPYNPGAHSEFAIVESALPDSPQVGGPGRACRAS
ncbi:UNVERIFIED_CONTAM: hypothetical protein Sradi_1755000 [Sesamum radiatum]|uniref:Uncharacterized protein n=1 Tax=Sesamum radiatum TaxID=300843 RepID=A0AAW2TX58_SESRA